MHADRPRSAGVCVPGVRFVDLAAGVLGLEWIDGRSVRALLGGADGDADPDALDNADAAADDDTLAAYGVTDGTRSYYVQCARVSDRMPQTRR
jgi:hypothetical protein